MADIDSVTEIMNLEKNIASILYRDIKTIIEDAKMQAVLQVNRALVIAYWNIGKLIKETVVEGDRAGYGKETLKQLGARLSIDYGAGFSEGNLSRMAKLYSCFYEKEILETLSQELSWSHFVEFIKVDDELKRDFYITMCANERWSVRTLRERMNSLLFERTAISRKPDETIRNDLALLKNEHKMTTSLFLKDPYFLDFLELKDNYGEKDIEDAIIMELEKFILEFGNDFAFLSRQKRIQIGGNDYYIDLLFYHRKLRRLIVVELKLGDFMPEYKGQVELYLKYLSKYEKQDNEEAPIAIILCSGKDNDVVELMDLEQDNIHISEYWLKLPPREILQQKLHKAVELAKAKIDNHSNLRSE
ncbi:MAG: PDDEXK nuclease domain-containing protein [Bacillota bacterium]